MKPRGRRHKRQGFGFLCPEDQGVLPHRTRGFLLLLGAMASKGAVPLIITEALAMQNATNPAQLLSRNGHRLQVGWVCGGAVAAQSQRVSPWTAAPQLRGEREKLTCVAFISDAFVFL